MRAYVLTAALTLAVSRFVTAQESDHHHHHQQTPVPANSGPIKVVKKVTEEDLAAGRQVLLPMPGPGNAGETFPIPEVGVHVHYDDTPPEPYKMHLLPDEIAALNTRVVSQDLVYQNGKVYPLDNLEGKYWVAAFIFTRCAGPCPVMSAAMKGLQEKFADVSGDDLRFVSITVDPTYDTPAVMTQYAERFSADPGRWLMLTGEYDRVYKLANSIFGVGLSKHGTGIDDIPGRLMSAPMPETIAHSRRFVLIDDKMIIRGYYEGIEPKEVERLERDLRTLLNDKVDVTSTPAALGEQSAMMAPSSSGPMTREEKMRRHREAMQLRLEEARAKREAMRAAQEAEEEKLMADQKAAQAEAEAKNQQQPATDAAAKP